METIFEGPQGLRLRKMINFVVIMLGVFLVVQVIGGLKQLPYIGAGTSAANTITVSGHGETNLTPDRAVFTFTVSSLKSTATAAQTEQATKLNAAIAYLKSAGVSDKDIKTSNYSVYPQYEYQNSSCPVNTSGAVIYCPPGKQVLTGYQASQSTTVKVRDIALAGELLAGVGAKGATDISQLEFTFDDPSLVQTVARDAAISDAKKKAEALAKQLGVKIVRVVSFNENSSGYQPPIAYAMDSRAEANQKTVAPILSPGENKVTGDVTITFEIR